MYSAIDDSYVDKTGFFGVLIHEPAIFNMTYLHFINVVSLKRFSYGF